MIYYVYVIKSEKDNQLFKGLTQDLEKRINQHNMGEYKLTKEFRPWVLLYSKVFTSKLEAIDHENYLKTEEGNEFLKKII